MGYTEQLLAQNEHIVFSTRQHWIVLIQDTLKDLVAAVIIAVLVVIGIAAASPIAIIGLVALLFPLGRFLIRLVVWRNEMYIITNRRVIEVHGVFRKRFSDSSLEKVNDVMMEQSLMGRILDFGDIRIITGADVGVNTFRRIAHPIQFKIIMMNQKAALSGVPGATPTESIPGLLARLDSLRHHGIITKEEYEQKRRELLSRLL